MKIAIHKSKVGWADSWVSYCKENDIDYVLVNAYDNDIIQQVNDCDAFMWHHHHANYKDALFAKQLLYSLQASGMKVFPNFNTTWHFDDKLGQKYLFEAIGIPLVPSYAFYSKKEAMKWVENTTFPKVFKLRGGAGSSNVKLVRTKFDGKKIVNRAFRKGFSQYDKLGVFKERFRKFRLGKTDFLDLLKGLARFIIPTEFDKMHGRERGYVYFQDFIPGNTFDIRVTVIANKAFALKRMVRENDFRASGSGNMLYDKKEIDERCIALAFNIADKMKSQSVALDFIFDEDKNPLLVEASFGFVVGVHLKCSGYWTSDMAWHERPFNPFGWMIDDFSSNS